MASAARAEARRRAILGRGSDRLAKLTTSARGESANAFVHDDPPLPDISPPGPSVWSEDQQKQSVDALMDHGEPSFSTGFPRSMNSGTSPLIHTTDDPLAALLSSISQNPGVEPAKSLADAANTPPTRLRKLMPLIHLVLVWSLLTYFALWKEPQAFEEQTRGAFLKNKIWERWADLLQRSSNKGGLGIQDVPFFWVFIALQIALHSVRIFSGFDTVRHPALLSIVLPHLPMPFPSIILNGLKYFQMGGVFLDDLAGLIVGIGVFIWISRWLTSAN